MGAQGDRALLALVEPLLRRLESHLAGAPLIIAVSGGSDSSALLDLVVRSCPAIPVHVAHVNHGWRGPASDTDEAFVAERAGRLGLPFHAVRLDQRIYPSGDEARARDGRYRALAEIAARSATRHVALGHQRDDQVETVLMRLIRGAGLRGLRGMAPRGFRYGTEMTASPSLVVHRPLLPIPRQDLIDYLRARSIAFREDRSNQDRRLWRNRVRLELLPRLRREAFPDLDDRLLELAALARDLVRLARERVRASCAPPPALWRGIALQASAVRRLPAALVVPGVLEEIAPLFAAAMPRRDALLCLRRQLLEAASRSRCRLTLRAGLEIRQDRSRWLLGHSVDEPVLDRPLRLTIPGTLAFPAWRRRLSADPVTGESLRAALLRADRDRWHAVVLLPARRPALAVRRRRPGDRVRMLGAPGHRRLKKVLAEAGLPAFQRDHLPLVVAGNEIVWIPGAGIAHGVRLAVRDAPRPDRQVGAAGGPAGNRPPGESSPGVTVPPGLQAVQLRFVPAD